MNRLTPLLAALLTAVALAGCTAGADASTRITIDFPEPHADVDDRVLLAASQDLAGAGVDVTAHHQLLAWSAQSGVDVDVREFPFGHCLDAIDHLPATRGCDSGSPAYWALSVNGEPSMVGMDEVILHDGDVVAWTYTPTGAAVSSADAPGLTVDPPAPTQQDMVMLTGTLDRAARLSVTGADPLDAPAGPWMVHLALEYGQTQVRVVADDGVGTSSQDIVLVRLAPATVSAEFASAIPPRAAIEDELWIDVDAFLSAPSYEGKGIPHPPHANVHDLLVAWTLAGRALEFSYHESFAFGVESIEGHGALSDWCYTVNGQSAELGITGQEFKPGDVIAWSGCFGA